MSGANASPPRLSTAVGGPDTPDRLQGVVIGLSRRNSAYRRMTEVCDQIAEATLTGADARDLAQMLAGLIRKTVVLLDPRFDVRACAGEDTRVALSPRWQPEDPGLVRLLRALAADRRPLRMPAVPDSVLTFGCLAIPIGIGATNLGYLLILDGADNSAEPADAAMDAEDTDDVDLLTASYVATLFALTLANERTSTDLGLRYQGAIVDALVSGHFVDVNDARRKAKALGIADEHVSRVAVIRPTSEAADLSEQAESLSARIVAAVPGTSLAIRARELVMILPDPAGPSTPGTLGEELTRLVVAGAEPTRLVCGLSGPTERPDEFPQLYRQAEHAIDIGARIGRGQQVVCYDDLGIYRLLLQIGDIDQLRRYADEVLGPLIRYDTAHKLGLVHTLSVFLEQRDSLKQAARRLHVHANTVAYRLQRIEQLTPLNLSDPEDRLVAHVAVKILEALHDQQ